MAIKPWYSSLLWRLDLNAPYYGRFDTAAAEHGDMGFESGESQTPPRACAAQPQPLPQATAHARESQTPAAAATFLPYSSDAGPHSRLLCLKQPSSVSSTPFPPGRGAAPPPGHSSGYPLPQLQPLSPLFHLLMLPRTT